MSEVILYFPDYSRKDNDSAVVGKALEECFPNDMVRVIDIHADDPDKAAEDFRNIYGYYPTMSTLRIESDAFFGFNNISFNYIPK